MIVSAIIILGTGQGSLTQAFTWDDLIVSFFNFSSMNFSNRAMKVVSYPFVILCKSAKIIPVIMVGTLRGVYSPTAKQFLIAIFITIGLLIFNFGKVSPSVFISDSLSPEFRWNLMKVSCKGSVLLLEVCSSTVWPRRRRTSNTSPARGRLLTPLCLPTTALAWYWVQSSTFMMSKPREMTRTCV